VLLKSTCKICGSPSIRSLGEIEGYRADTFFEVMECSVCGTNFASPAEPDEKIYEAIYKNVATVPGYSRYLRYARQVVKEKDPLHYLMNCEDCYWGITQTLLAETRGRRSENLIWEIGCGQGYLTYALVRAGFNAIGMDLSETAVASARRRYGNLFFCEEAKTFFMKTKVRPSFIILSEVIEHLPDPVLFISELMDYLKPGGAIIVTTPNKAFCPPGVIWNTEPPPVHFWWFTAKGLEAIGEKLSCRVVFAKLDEFYSENVCFRKVAGGDLYRRAPVLDNEYRVITPAARETVGIASILKSILKRVLPRNALRQIRIKRAALSGLVECTAATPITLCAIYSALPGRLLRSNLDKDI
jgi:SAM-dependent methyltransferase